MSNMTEMSGLHSSGLHPSGLHAIVLPAGSRTIRIETPVILAPMSGVTDLPFRRLAKRHGAGWFAGVPRLSLAEWRGDRRRREASPPHAASPRLVCM